MNAEIFISRILRASKRAQPPADSEAMRKLEGRLTSNILGLAVVACVNYSQSRVSVGFFTLLHSVTDQQHVACSLIMDALLTNSHAEPNNQAENDITSHFKRMVSSLVCHGPPSPIVEKGMGPLKLLRITQSELQDL